MCLRLLLTTTFASVSTETRGWIVVTWRQVAGFSCITDTVGEVPLLRKPKIAGFAIL